LGRRTMIRVRVSEIRIDKSINTIIV
jgi:hypothetical protein